MAGKKGASGLGKKILDIMQEEPTQTYTKYEMAELVGCSDVSAGNSLSLLHKSEKIKRHKDKKGNLRQYAIDIPDKDNDLFEKGPSRRSTKKTKKTAPMTVKEVRAVFMQIQNLIAGMEDEVVAIVEQNEKIQKIKNQMEEL